ncbi:PAS domain-containing protein [Phenylobacterium sp.]|uniref:sensor histidine kinase n=1 Tax=Phenylobacterium sp. TaxID=1871053 RepID=UPI00121FFE9F|nr:PAS domain-containing protein [Phenylobacterium sp.]THD58589.1 MAG: PAS domain S-box protein [Phenylobacterium sp.]
MSASVEELGGYDPIVRSAADATALGMAFVLECRPDGTRRFVFAGPRCLSVNGISGEAAMTDASLVFDRILPDHRTVFDAAEAEARQGLTALDVEVAMRGADDRVRWRRFAALPRQQPDGGVLWDGLQIDVTERRDLAAELLEQRRRLEVAVEAAGLGFWEWDIAASKVSWSERNKTLYGLGADEEITIGRYLRMVHPDDVENVRSSFLAVRDRPQGGDYAIEHRIVRTDGEVRWLLVHGRVSPDASGEAGLVVGTSLDITERKAAEERRALLMGELAHRSKNGIAVLMAIVSQTARNAASVESFEEQIMSRLQAMAASQDLVTAVGGGPVALSDVIAKALAPFGRGRVDVNPAIGGIVIRGEMAVGMGLLLHEMATNAVKYGALSAAGGRVALSPLPSADGQAAFSWRETGGPPPPAEIKPGFGTRLLEQVLRPQGGQVSFAFDASGFQARVEFPTVR